MPAHAAVEHGCFFRHFALLCRLALCQRRLAFCRHRLLLDSGAAAAFAAAAALRPGLGCCGVDLAAGKTRYGAQGGDCGFDLTVVRLARGQPLHGQAGRDQDAHQLAVGVFQRQAEQFIGKPGDQRQADNFDQDAVDGVRLADKGEEDDHQEHHHHQEAGAAAHMDARVLAHVFRRQLHAGFIGVDRLMLRAVIGKKPFDIVHAADGQNIAEEQPCAQQAFDQAAAEIADILVQPGGEENRKNDEDEHGKDERGEDGGEDLPGGELFILCFAGLRRRPGQVANAAHHAGAEIGHAAHHRQPEKRMLLGKRFFVFNFIDQATVLVAHGDRLAFGAGHHHAFDDSLPAVTDRCHKPLLAGTACAAPIPILRRNSQPAAGDSYSLKHYSIPNSHRQALFAAPGRARRMWRVVA